MGAHRDEAQIYESLVGEKGLVHKANGDQPAHSYSADYKMVASEKRVRIE
jgi:hypothetical protein